LQQLPSSSGPCTALGGLERLPEPGQTHRRGGRFVERDPAPRGGAGVEPTNRWL